MTPDEHKERRERHRREAADQVRVFWAKLSKKELLETLRETEYYRRNAIAQRDDALRALRRVREALFE